MIVHLIVAAPISAPIMIDIIKTGVSLFKTPVGLDSSNSRKLKEVVPDIFERINDLRDDILIYSQSIVKSLAAACKSNPFGVTPFIITNKEFAEVLEVEDSDILHWIYKHEIGHIYFNHGFKGNLLRIFAGFVSSYVLFRLLPLAPQRMLLPCFFAIPFVAWMIARIIFHIADSFFERSADDFANAYSTNEELLGGRRFCQMNQDFDLNEFLQELNELTSGSGVQFSHVATHNRWDPHPPYNERIKTIENEMKRRGMDVETIDTASSQYLGIKKALRAYYFNELIQAHPSRFSTEVVNDLKNHLKLE